MNTQIVEQAARVSRITAEIVAISEQAAQIAAMSAIRIGGLLKEAKELVAPGEWGDYVNREVNFSHRTANNCMKLHTEWEQNPHSQALANFSYTKAVRLLSLPEGEREEFIEQNDVEGMSTRELEAAIRDRNAAQAEALQLRSDLDAAQRATDSAKAAEEKALKEKQKAQDAQIRAEAELKKLQNNPDVPPEVAEKIRKDAIAATEAEFQKKLAATQKELDAAAAAQQDAQKAMRMADPDVAAFNILLIQLQENYNKINGYRLRIKAKDEDLYARCTAAQNALLQEFGRAVS